MIIKTQSISFEHKKAVESLRAEYGHSLSSHAFASLYIWKEQMGLSLLITPKMFTVRCKWKGPNSWFFPCGDKNAALEFISSMQNTPDFCLCYLSWIDAKWLNSQFPGRWQLLRDTGADEYLYDVNGHMTLLGGEYANMRTQVHKVEREYAPYTMPLTNDNLDDALEILSQWRHGYKRFGSSGLRDEMVDEKALLMRHQLGVTGIILYLKDKPVAISAGFMLTDDIFDMAVSKSISLLQGVSYYAKRELFKCLSCSTINLEEDLGIEGLRRMKTGMHPIGKNEIWEARLI